MTLRTLVNIYLESEGVSVYKLSIDTGISESTLHKWLKGDSSPRLHTAEKVMKFIGLEYTIKHIRKPIELTIKGDSRTLAPEKESTLNKESNLRFTDNEVVETSNTQAPIKKKFSIINPSL